MNYLCIGIYVIFRYDVVVEYFLRRYLNGLFESNEDMKQALLEKGWNIDPNSSVDQDLITSLYGKYCSFKGNQLLKSVITIILTVKKNLSFSCHCHR